MATKVSRQLPLDVGHGTVPYSLATRRERSRELAQKRRTTYKTIMDDLTRVLPFPKDVVAQLDYNSKLRLALCFFRLKALIGSDESKMDDESGMGIEGCETGFGDSGMSLAVAEPRSIPSVFPPGLVQNLMTEALDGFLMVVLADGSVVYVSESIHRHLGLFQSEHIGISLYDLVLADDHAEVRDAIAKAEADVLSRMAVNATANISFFCRIKCSRFKVANTVTKSPGYKLVYVSGQFKVANSETFLVVTVKPVSPPSILEIRMEGNMYVMHYDLQMKCTFYDGRMRHLLGYSKNDLVGKLPFEHHHHDDVEATLECSRGIMSKGEGLSGYYRYMSRFGEFVWLQSRATLMFDSRTGKPSYIVCMNFVINKHQGDRELELRKAITASESSINEDGNRSHDPFPFNPREDGNSLNPLDMTDDGDFERESVSTPPATEPAAEVEVAKKLEDMEEFDEKNSVPASNKFLSPNPSPPRSASPQSTTPSSSVFDSNDSILAHPHSTSPVENCLPDSTTSTSSSPVQDDSISSKTFSIASSQDTGYEGSISSLSRSEELISSSSLSDSLTGICHSTAEKTVPSPTTSVFGSDASSLPPSIPSIFSTGSTSSVSSLADVSPHSSVEPSRLPPVFAAGGGGMKRSEAVTNTNCQKMQFPSQENFEFKFQPNSTGVFPGNFQSAAQFNPVAAHGNQHRPGNALPNWSTNQLPPPSAYVKQEPIEPGYSATAPIDLTNGGGYFNPQSCMNRQQQPGNLGAGFHSAGQAYRGHPLPQRRGNDASFQMPSNVSSSVIVIDDGGMGHGGFGMGSLPELTGDDLKVLDFIETMDTSGGGAGSISQMPQFVSGNR